MTQKKRLSNTSTTGKRFREKVLTDLRQVVRESDPMKVLEVCIRQMVPSWEKECGSPLQAAKMILQIHKTDHPWFSVTSVTRVAEMARAAFPLVNAAAEKAVAYAESVMDWTESLREILRQNKLFQPIYSVRSQAWTAADEAVVAALFIRAVFDEPARMELAAEAAGIVGARSPTRAKALITALEAA